MTYNILLILALGGVPAQACVIDPGTKVVQVFHDLASCQAAGKAFLLPAANPQKTVRSFICVQLAPGKSKCP